MEPTIRAVVVDDEPLACGLLRELLEEHPDVLVVGEARNSAEAATVCAATSPHVLLLDIDMPAGSGLDLLRTLSPVPAIIFTTAHAEYAVSAFEVNAVDYLLKPIDRERLGRALNRLRQKLARPGVALAPASPASRRVAFRLPSQIVFVASADIEWIGAEGNYCRVHASGKSVLVREVMTAIEQRLEPGRFVRVHRSAIVNVDAIDRIDVDGNGRYAIVLHSGAQVPVGATYRKELQSVLGEVL